MQSELLNLLTDPEDLATELVYDTSQNSLKGKQHIYRIEEGVPILLVPTAQEMTEHSEHHQAAHTDFAYVDHYIKDGELFDYFEPVTDPATLHEHRRLHEAILNELSPVPERVLDVGCGSAWVARRYSGTATKVFSFDISDKNTKQALSLYPVDNHFAVTGDVYRLPFRENSFDGIISAEVIEHVPNLHGYLANLIRVLKPGGRLVISTPYNEKIIYSLCIHCNRPTPQHAHLHVFTEVSMQKILEKHTGIQYHMLTLSNKALLKLRSHVVLKYLPFSIWRAVDRMANFLIKKPARLVVVIEKEGE